jgi:hypothetical protein
MAARKSSATPNPFDEDNTPDEAQTEVENSGAEWLPEEDDRPVMVTDPKSEIVVTLKAGTGFDSPWVVVHADTIDSALDKLSDESLPELLQQTGKAAKYFQNNYQPAPKKESSGGGSNRGSGGGNRRGGNFNSGSSDSPGNDDCSHGRNKRSGSKNGKPWTAYFCADDLCDPIWER